MNPPLSRFLADTYAFKWLDEQVDLMFDRLHESRTGDLTAEVEVRCSRDVPNALLHHARLNLVSTRSRADVIRALGNRIPESQIDWSAALEYACHLAITHWREGEPFIDLRDVPQREGTRFLLEPYVEHVGATVLFADGGTGKSLFGLAIGVAVASGAPVLGACPARTCKVAYLDWESDAEIHAERRRAICAGANLSEREAPIYYRRQVASLAESAPHIRRFIAENEIGFAIIDSMGMARGGEPESADSTIRLFAAARTLGIPWLGIDHVTKNGGDGQSRPFGSIYTHNSARLTWGLEKIEDLGNGKVILATTNHKTNNGKPLGRRGYDAEFRDNDRDQLTWASYASKDIRDIPGFFDRLGQPQQIAEVLKKNGRATPPDIQRALEADGVIVKADTIRVQLNRHKDRFVKLGDSKDGGIWGLRADGY